MEVEHIYQRFTTTREGRGRKVAGCVPEDANRNKYTATAAARDRMSTAYLG